MVDVVYTWCELNASISSSCQFDNNINRFDSNEELRYSIRGVFKYAPWVRRIFIVCDDTQRPSWLIEQSENTNIPVTIVKHSDIIPKEFLPTYNSQAIEMFLCMIPELSEQFIYLNDDMFIGAPVKVEDFYIHNKPCYVMSAYVPRQRHRLRCQHDFALRNNVTALRSLLENKQTVTYKPEHQALPMLKSSLVALLTSENPVMRQFVKNTCLSPYRQTNNIYIMGLAAHWNWAHDKAYISKKKRRSIYISIMANSHFGRIQRQLIQSRPKLFCLNDVCESEKQRPKMKHALNVILNKYYPFKTVCEKTSL